MARRRCSISGWNLACAVSTVCLALLPLLYEGQYVGDRISPRNDILRLGHITMIFFALCRCRLGFHTNVFVLINDFHGPIFRVEVDAARHNQTPSERHPLHDSPLSETGRICRSISTGCVLHSGEMVNRSRSMIGCAGAADDQAAGLSNHNALAEIIRSSPIKYTSRCS